MTVYKCNCLHICMVRCWGSAHAPTPVWLLFCVQSALFYLRGERKSSGVATSQCLRHHFFFVEVAVVFYLMRTRHASKNGTDLQPRTGKDLVVSHNQRSRVNIIVWGLHKDLTTLEVRAKIADMYLESFVRGNVLWEGDHIRLVLTKKDSKGVSSELVKQVSAILRKIGCLCVIDKENFKV